MKDSTKRYLEYVGTAVVGGVVTVLLSPHVERIADDIRDAFSQKDSQDGAENATTKISNSQQEISAEQLEEGEP